MTPAGTTARGNGNGRSAEIDQKMDGLSSRMDETAARVASMDQNVAASLKEITDRLRSLEIGNTAILTALQEQMAAANKRIEETRQSVASAKVDREKALDDLSAQVRCLDDEVPERLRERLETIEKALPSLILSNKIMVFVASALVITLLGFLWAIFTGQAAILFK